MGRVIGDRAVSRREPVLEATGIHLAVAQKTGIPKWNLGK